MSADLRDTLRQNEVETMLTNAELTIQSPQSPERAEEASRQVHLAMYKVALGQISRDQRDRILEMLRPCCPEVFASAAKPDDDWPLPLPAE